jgi:hypothetical protein
MPEQASRRGLLEGFSESFNDFKDLHKKGSQVLLKPSALIQKN